jgi:hypothetical protein
VVSDLCGYWATSISLDDNASERSAVMAVVFELMVNFGRNVAAVERAEFLVEQCSLRCGWRG